MDKKTEFALEVGEAVNQILREIARSVEMTEDQKTAAAKAAFRMEQVLLQDGPNREIVTL